MLVVVVKSSLFYECLDSLRSIPALMSEVAQFVPRYFFASVAVSHFKWFPHNLHQICLCFESLARFYYYFMTNLKVYLA